MKEVAGDYCSVDLLSNGNFRLNGSGGYLELDQAELLDMIKTLQKAYEMARESSGKG